MALAAHVDTLVLADTFQYSRQSFQNRARLRNPDGWQWISVPLHGRSAGTAIVETRVDNREPWQRKHWRAFEYNYRSTPFFAFYEHDLAPLFDREWQRLGDLTCATVTVLCKLLELDVDVVRASEVAGAPGTLPAVLEERGATGDQLVALPDAAGRNSEMVDGLQLLEVEAPTYRQNFEGFEAGMSALDLLFNYGPSARAMLHDAGRIHRSDQ